MKCKKSKAVFSFALALVLLFTSLCFSPLEVSADSTLDQLRQEQAELAQKIQANKNALAQLESDKNNQEAYLSKVNDNITYTRNQLSNLNNQIEIINGQVAAVENTIATLQKEIGEIEKEIKSTKTDIKEAENSVKITYANLSQRLESSYLTGNESTLKILLGSDSIATFLTRLEFMKRVSENDANLINSFKAEIEVLKVTRKSLKERTDRLEEKQETIKNENQYLYEKQDELKNTKKELDTTASQLENQYSEIESYIAKLDQNSTAYKNLIAKQEQEEAAAEAQIQAIIAANASTSTNGDSSIVAEKGYICPIKYSNRYISSYFGWRNLWGKKNYHGGVDIAGGGIYGQPIYAARSGKVIRTDNYETTTYGKYFIIDHGDGYITLYAHCSKLAVVEGQYVKQGQIVAYVGETGRTSGPHLHFEVRKDNVRQNPLNYIKV